MKPGLVRRMAMTSSFIGTLSSRSSSAVYLARHPKENKYHTLFHIRSWLIDSQEVAGPAASWQVTSASQVPA